MSTQSILMRFYKNQIDKNTPTAVRTWRVFKSHQFFGKQAVFRRVADSRELIEKTKKSQHGDLNSMPVDCEYYVPAQPSRKNNVYK